MSHQTIQDAPWKDEVKTLGVEGCIADRLQFHGTLEQMETSRLTGASRQTVLRIFAKLVADNKAAYTPGFGPESDMVAITQN